MNICLTSSEFTPLAKTGGLADVTAALSQYLHEAGHDIRVLLPKYSTIDTSDLRVVPVDFLQQIPIDLGPHRVVFSIDVTTLPGSDLPIYLLNCPDLYDRSGIYTAGDDEHLRFVALSRAAIEMCQRMAFSPSIFHCHDWHTSLIPLYLKSVYAWDDLFASTRSVLTIHNIGYQGVFRASRIADLGLDGAEEKLHQDDLRQGRINFFKTGLLYADLLTTVSPTYAREIQTSDYGMGLQDLLRARHVDLIGILNGVDYRQWNPETDTLIPHNYSSRDLSGKRACKLELMKETGLTGGVEMPLMGIVTRLAGQKGIDLIEKVMPIMLSRHPFALAVLGSGEPRYELFFERLQQSFPGRVFFYRGYNNQLAHWIEAGSDIFLMPSLYEPCGLNQMYSLKYGTVPIVRQTGGLADSVQLYDPETGSGDGVVFRDYNEVALGWAIRTALDLYSDQTVWQTIVVNGMEKDFSWQKQGEKYVQLFRALTA